MIRYPDWPVRLNQYLAAVRYQPFQYGVHDCCTFTAGAILAMTGVDPMAEYRDQYHDQETAGQALREFGHGTLLKTLYKKFGKPVTPGFARKGDIGIYKGACGIVLGERARFISEDGMAEVRISQLLRVFRVD